MRLGGHRGSSRDAVVCEFAHSGTSCPLDPEASSLSPHYLLDSSNICFGEARPGRTRSDLETVPDKVSVRFSPAKVFRDLFTRKRVHFQISAN